MTSKDDKKRGPKPETVKIEGDWINAIKRALKKKPLERPGDDENQRDSDAKSGDENPD